jgi:hypothetical protein
MHKAIAEHFADNPDLLPVWLQTVFEGHSTNTYQAGLTYLEVTHDIENPFYGHVAGTSGPPAILNQYNDGQYLGTPYTLIVDKYGEPVVHDFSTDFNQQNLINVIEGVLSDQ